MNREQKKRTEEIQEWMSTVNSDDPAFQVALSQMKELLIINQDIEKRLMYSSKKSHNRRRSLKGLQDALKLYQEMLSNQVFHSQKREKEYQDLYNQLRRTQQALPNNNNLLSKFFSFL